MAHLLAGGAAVSPDHGLELGDLIEAVPRGAWRGLQSLELPDAARAVRTYLDQIRRTGIVAVDGVKRDPERVLAVLRSLARHVAT